MLVHPECNSELMFSLTSFIILGFFKCTLFLTFSSMSCESILPWVDSGDSSLFSMGILLLEVSKFSLVSSSLSSTTMFGKEPLFGKAGLKTIFETLVVSPLGFSGETELLEATDWKNLFIVLKVFDKKPVLFVKAV